MKTVLYVFIVFILLFSIVCSDSSKEKAVPQYKYIGSINSTKYHRPTCEWAKKIKPKNAIYFKDKKEAEQIGYVPCKVCKP